MKICFVTRNACKAEEVNTILSGAGVSVVPVSLEINELQTKCIDLIARDKVLKAFEEVGRPVFVEHTGIYIDSLNGFPGGLTQVFWDTLEADKFSELFGNLSQTGVTAKTIIAYCDAKEIHVFEGEVKGNVSPEPRGDRTFQWDCVFIPEGFDRTFAELGEEKNNISMRKKAFDKFKAFIQDKNQ